VVLAPYNENMEVPPYFKSFKSDEIAAMAKHYKLSPKNLEGLVSRVENWLGTPGVLKEGQLGYMSERNPQSKWDWYVVGGRWDRGLRNVIPVKKALDKLAPPEAYNEKGEWVDGAWEHYYSLGHLTPRAIVDPDGGWHEKGRMGWFGISEGDRSDWPQRVETLLRRVAEERPKTVAVVVDFHI